MAVHCCRPLSALAPLLVMLAGCGGGQGTGDGAVDAAREPVATTAAPAPRAAPRWESVATFSGSGPSETPSFAILPGAIQWRVRYRCEAGEISLTAAPGMKKPGPLVTGPCPKEGEVFAIEPGERRLRVEAGGPWMARVDQQLETALQEPAMPEMAAGTVVGSGAFYGMEKEGKGTAKLYQLPDGRRALRLEDLDMTQNVDLFVWLSELASPKTSAEVVANPYAEIALLKSTLGSQNYLVPPELPTERIRSVVIWCEPVRIAYTAAALGHE